MKRPEKIVMWTHVDKEKSEYVNHLGKPLFNYTIKLPSWIGLAYNPRDIKIEIRDKNPCFSERFEDGNHEEIRAYVKENWGKKLTKMRKLNHNYMQIFTLARADIRQNLSLEEYNQYHRELRELNAKYGVGKSIDSDSKRIIVSRVSKEGEE